MKSAVGTSLYSTETALQGSPDSTALARKILGFLTKVRNPAREILKKKKAVFSLCKLGSSLLHSKVQSFIFVSIRSFTSGSLLLFLESAFYDLCPLILRKRHQVKIFNIID